MRSAVILLALLATVNEAAKVTPMILACTAQSEERIASEPVPELKDAITRLTARVKLGDFKGAQQVLKEGTDDARNKAINKYMVDKCASLKSCLVCPLEMA
ncbi:hypothetical protein PRIPAC_88285 [Pristionchus pacificus]|uniref:Uncharacterized protein n=1 Tax=Pristionchus pacificus TaxID=54126 RepID=A0A2A6CXN8_PRIPA|nr:hypothetical protein PRIPAC_88285 [Pristionchus pacificus]|eukprot:PDM82793.1 hypothetical protein PRIPAC_37186 [Pristionchus pacificus]